MENMFQIESKEDFINVTEEVLNNLFSSKENPSLCLEQHKIRGAKEEFKNLMKSCNFDIPMIAEHLKTKGYDADKVENFLSLLDKKKSDILYATFIHHNSLYGETMVDFDWVLKLVHGTSELTTLNYPLLQLILSTVNSSGEQSQSVFEINKEMLAKIINLLESIEEEQ